MEGWASLEEEATTACGPRSADGVLKRTHGVSPRLGREKRMHVEVRYSRVADRT